MRKTLLAGAVVALGLVAGVVMLVHNGGDRNLVSKPRPAGPAPAALDERLRQADAANGATLFGQCAACHSIGRSGVDLDGPNLYGVVGSALAERRPRYAYSAALRRAGGTWSLARLDAWLTNPAAFAPGTRMAFGGLADPRDRADVIAFLATQGANLPLP